MSPAAALNRLAPESRGALAVVAAMFIFVCMDSIAKMLAEDLPPLQVVWARYMSQTVLIMVIFAPRLPQLVRSAAPGVQLTRGVLLFMATSLFFTALASMELADAVALMELAPLIITVLAALILREHVGPRRWAGVVVGLIGALIILRPGLGVFQPAGLLVVGAATCLASYQIATRMLGQADSIWTTMLYTTGFGAVASTLAMPWIWQTPEAGHLPLMALIGVIGFVGHLCLVWGLGQAPASVLAPFNYTGLVWAMLLGFIIFGDLPDGWTISGGAVIVGAGLYVWHRERVRRPAQGT